MDSLRTGFFYNFEEETINYLLPGFCFPCFDNSGREFNGRIYAKGNHEKKVSVELHPGVKYEIKDT